MAARARKQPKKDKQPEREKLHRLVDAIPDEETVVAELFLEYLKCGRSDSALLADATAPWDDEPTTPEEDEGAAEAWQEYLRGEARPWEEVRKELLSE